MGEGCGSGRLGGQGGWCDSWAEGRVATATQGSSLGTVEGRPKGRDPEVGTSLVTHLPRKTDVYQPLAKAGRKRGRRRGQKTLDLVSGAGSPGSLKGYKQEVA